MTDTNDLELIPGNVKNAVAGASSADLWMVQRKLIRTHPKLQPRDKHSQKYKERVRFLADLIKANGYDRAFPIKVYVARENNESVLYLVQGHTRLDAVDLVNSEGGQIEVIPCVTTERGTSMEDLLIATVTGNEGEPLTPIEKAKVVRELMGWNLELDTIAQRLGYTRAYINNLLSLLEAPRDVREMVQEGKVAAAVAIKTVKEHGTGALRVLKEGLEIAKSKGKEKVTPKHLKPASEKAQGIKSTPIKVQATAVTEKQGPVKEENLMLQRAAQWIVENATPEQEAQYLSLAAAMLEVTPESVQDAAQKLRGNS